MLNRLLPLLLFALVTSSSALAQGEAMMPGIFLPAESRVGFPPVNVFLTLNTEGFTLMQSGTSKSGMGTQFFAVHRSNGIVMSLFLEFTAEKGDALAARDHYWSKMEKSPMKKEGIKLSVLDGVPIVEHTVTEAMGETANQK